MIKLIKKTVGVSWFAVLKPTNQTSTLEFEVYCVVSLPEISFHLGPAPRSLPANVLRRPACRHCVAFVLADDTIVYCDADGFVSLGRPNGS
jgi:hypothetical protein